MNDFFFLDAPQASTSTILQTQSQPTTMLTNHQQQITQNSHPVNQPPQSFSYSTIPPTQHAGNNIIPHDPVKQVTHPPPSTTTTTTASAVPETIENSHVSISSSPTPSSISHTSEALQPSLPSDAQQPSVRLTRLMENQRFHRFISRYPVVYNNWKLF